jgi:hypothetical protein
MESPSEDDIANYRSWRRKLRRRFPFPCLLDPSLLLCRSVGDAAIYVLWRDIRDCFFALYAVVRLLSHSPHFSL